LNNDLEAAMGSGATRLDRGKTLHFL
jgi:hypothetical protein